LLSHRLHSLDAQCCQFLLMNYFKSLFFSQKVVLSARVHVKGWTSV
jgi:hypothetical protein